MSSGFIKSKQLSQMSTLTSSYDVAWRKHDFAKYVTDVIPYNSQDGPGWVSSPVLASKLAVVILLTVQTGRRNTFFKKFFVTCLPE